MEVRGTEKIYPKLPLDPSLSALHGLTELALHDGNPQSFRLQEISNIKKYFEDEIEFRRKIFAKYKKAFGIITCSDCNRVSNWCC